MEFSYSAIPEKQDMDVEGIDSNIIIVVPGEVITTEPGFLKYLLINNSKELEAMVCIWVKEKWLRVFVE